MLFTKDLIAASATPLVLAILRDQDSYGYAIIKRVKELSEDKIQWTEGMLYPVLHRLEKQELISSYWQTSQTGRQRKYYRITLAGAAELEELKSQWRIVNSALNKSWENGKFVTFDGIRNKWQLRLSNNSKRQY